MLSRLYQSLVSFLLFLFSYTIIQYVPDTCQFHAGPVSNTHQIFISLSNMGSALDLRISALKLRHRIWLTSSKYFGQFFHVSSSLLCHASQTAPFWQVKCAGDDDGDNTVLPSLALFSLRKILWHGMLSFQLMLCEDVLIFHSCYYMLI